MVEFFKRKLLQRNYSVSEIDKIVRNTANLTRENLLIDNVKTNHIPLVLVTKYSPALKQLKKKHY